MAQAGAAEPRRAHPSGLLNAHTTWAYVLIILAIWIAAAATRARRSVSLAPALTGLLGVLLAYGSGLAYYEAESNLWSYLMTIGFVVAVVSYAVAGRVWARR